MMTATISIKPHLAEYMKARYGQLDGIIRLPDSDDLYHLIWQLMGRTPAGVNPFDRQGNLVMALPDRRLGKDPAVFNYLSHRSEEIIEKKIRQLFTLELHQAMDANAHNGHLLTNQEMVCCFMAQYGIESISEDALLKDYYRWRDLVRRRKKRQYRRRRE